MISQNLKLVIIIVCAVALIVSIFTFIDKNMDAEMEAYCNHTYSNECLVHTCYAEYYMKERNDYERADMEMTLYELCELDLEKEDIKDD